ncbi:helix-turn-helix domain-containing protein [Microtetraspora niveoalba]|uniref:helix-turn-helix domain-containing protein n=1 Tax=Microtetraspora niveoalba TaxID=46175 RepID=UPI000832BBB4|nr:pyridoxamine 5'-phosphate oxidase family protein [Microtetraspora niveoalba]
MSRRTVSPGDLGRRIAHHRKRLGLSREDLAERAGMAPGFVEYVEEAAASITEEALLRLAAALETTPDDLLGGGMDRPPGQGPAAAHPVLHALDPEECMRLISSGGVGRVAFSGHSGPTVLPVNFKVHKGAIVFRTQHGGPMEEAMRTGMEGVELTIGFEVDHIDEVNREGWSVLVQGPAHYVSGDELAEATGTGVQPWAGGVRETYISVHPHTITGRRIRGF